MVRTPVLLALLLSCAFGLSLPFGHADEAPAAAEDTPPVALAAALERPPLASDEDVQAVLERFKEEYKARGLKGEEKLSQRDFALSNLAVVQHPDVVKALSKVSKASDPTLRLLGVIYLGEQTAMPGLAGPAILRAMKRARKDSTMLMSGLQSLSNLRYLGATEEVAALMEHKEFAVKKSALTAAGRIGDMRLWREILKYAGVAVRALDDIEENDGKDGGGQDEVIVEEGWSYDGVEVTYDTGAAGDGDQKMAEKLGKAQLAANKAAAGGGRGPGGGGGARGGGGAARDPKELLPAALDALFRLTGEKFADSREVAGWVRENKELILATIDELDAMEKQQAKDAKALR